MIRFAKYEDIPRIMGFIDTYWKKNHIIGRKRKFFEFQHVWGDEISFVLSEDNGEIHGILGFVPYGPSDFERDIMLAIWKARKTEDTMLGIKILEFLRNSPHTKSVSAPGINPKTRTIYQFLGLETGCMKQWYRLRPMDVYKIAVIKDKEIPKYEDSGSPQIEEYIKFEDLTVRFNLEECLVRKRQPLKTLEYLEKRYFHHPVFQYLKYGIQYEGKKLLVILRIQSYGGTNVLRMIDGIGDHEIFRYFTGTLDMLMEQYGCEYADIYETGIADDIFIDGGWKLTSATDNIIPEYFSPFEQKNIDIYYMSSIPGVVLFKGDGDMDRPN